MHYFIESLQVPCVIGIIIISILQRRRASKVWGDYSVGFVRGGGHCLTSERKCMTFFLYYLHVSITPVGCSRPWDSDDRNRKCMT